MLSSGPATRSELMKASGGHLAQVAYHSKVLCLAGCIRTVESTPQDPSNPLYELL